MQVPHTCPPSQNPPLSRGFSLSLWEAGTQTGECTRPPRSTARREDREARGQGGASIAQVRGTLKRRSILRGGGGPEEEGQSAELGETPPRLLHDWTLAEAGVEQDDVLWCRYLMLPLGG